MTTHDEIEQALANATQGPWTVDGAVVYGVGEAFGRKFATRVCLTENGAMAQRDAHLIANSPAWLRALLDENESHLLTIAELRRDVARVEAARIEALRIADLMDDCADRRLRTIADLLGVPADDDEAIVEALKAHTQKAGNQ